MNTRPERQIAVDTYNALVTKAALGTATASELAELAPYKVENAIIMAAGSGSRLAPLSYEKPKGMLRVHGEVLIERLIRQLHEAGIADIVVVVGYMKEAFFYLEDDFGVSIVINDEYADRNNHSSLMAARKYLGNTCVCASDQYFDENIFQPYMYEPCCSVVPGADEPHGLVAKVDKGGFIAGWGMGEASDCCLRCPVYFNRDVAKRFLGILGDEYDEPATAHKRWSDVYLDHADELWMKARVLPDGVLHEFDYFGDLCDFERDFIDNVDSSILDNICVVLGCGRAEIRNIQPLSQGLTNLSFLFSCRDVSYVYRYPGAGTDKIINRESETWSQDVARRLGLDETFVFEDASGGWKISRYLSDCTPFDYRDPKQVAAALHLIRRLHECGETSPWAFDFYDEACKIIAMLRLRAYPLPPDVGVLGERIDQLAGYVHEDAVEPCLCHNDFYGPNLLVKDDAMSLIDWEYSAMGDYAGDIGNFIAQGSGYTVDEAVACLDVYFGRPATSDEVRHCMAQTAIVGYYWYVWAIYKESQGNPVGEWLYIWYRAAKTFSAYALELYDI